MSQAAVFRACQIPSRLGLPFGNRGTGPLLSEPVGWPLAARCPRRNAVAVASTSTTPTTRAVVDRKRIVVLLLDSTGPQIKTRSENRVALFVADTRRCCSCLL